MRKILSTFIISYLFLAVFPKISLPLYAVDCSAVTIGGNLDITTSCTFSGTVNGVDSGTGTQNSALLSVGSTGTLTVNPSQQIGMGTLSLQTGGAIVLFDGGSLSFGKPICTTDADSDGYPSSTTQIISSTAPPNARRRNVMTTITNIDSNDTFSCPNNSNPAGLCNLCSIGNVANQVDGQDLFGDCLQTFNSCNGAGSCSLHAKRVFISSQTYNGNLGNLTGADSKCQSLANNAGLNSSWKAWLSSTTISTSSRMNQSSLPYVLVNGQTKIADNWSSLIDGNLDNPILLSETGQNLGSNLRVWTNTTSNGNIYSTSNQSSCTNWTSVLSSRNARIGINSLNSSGEWTDSADKDCNSNSHLYCFEQ